jgi:hypothetical protein
MNRFPGYIGDLYARLLYLYPRRFRSEFADEMNEVFRNSIQTAAEEGMGSPVVRLWQGAPGSALQYIEGILARSS